MQAFVAVFVYDWQNLDQERIFQSVPRISDCVQYSIRWGDVFNIQISNERGRTSEYPRVGAEVVLGKNFLLQWLYISCEPIDGPKVSWAPDVRPQTIDKYLMLSSLVFCRASDGPVFAWCIPCLHHWGSVSAPSECARNKYVHPSIHPAELLPNNTLPTKTEE